MFKMFYEYCLNFLFAPHLFHEGLGWLEAGDVVGSDGDGGVLADITRSLGGATLNHKTAETAQVHVLLLLKHAIFNGFHEAFHNNGYLFSL